MKYDGFFDTHAHYDHALFGGRGPDILLALREGQILSGVVIPAITYDSCFRRDLFPEERFPWVYFAPGLHPKCATNEPWWEEEKRERFLRLLEEPRTVAVKTGLDYGKSRLTPGQKAHLARFFAYLTDLANARGLPLVLHVREAWEDTAALLRAKPPAGEAAVHCYTGDRAAAEALMEAGVTRFGIGGMLTRDGMDALRDSVRALPLSALLLETDAPFVRPRGYTGAVNTSAVLPELAERIAGLKGLPGETVAEALRKNAEEFYGLS